ncbi:MAG: UDP-2,4-diacetamido-2,4,6-trideoxy-beta-L-altropyranose hydrolase [Candidatus Limnocylindrales bacterium]
MRPLGGRRLIVRADATTASGTGHMMRALALTQAWLDAGGRAKWLVAEAPEALLGRIAAEGVPVERLAAASGGTADAAALKASLAIDPGAVGVVDGMGFDANYLAELDGVAGRVLVVDDMAALTAYPVALVLNQNAHADRSSYPSATSCRFLLGTRYVVLRREFVADPPVRTIPARASRLLLTFGGADPTGMTARTIGALRRLSGETLRDVALRVIIGAANRDTDRIRALLAAGPGLDATLAIAVADMPAQMAWCDLAITSGGTTVWELARMGCPALVVETAPSEVLLVSGLARVGLFDTLGQEAGMDEEHMVHGVGARIADARWRATMSALGMELVDGRGAGRVVEALAGLA